MGRKEKRGHSSQKHDVLKTKAKQQVELFLKEMTFRKGKTMVRLDLLNRHNVRNSASSVIHLMYYLVK